jgi:hypothetical protein
MWRRGRIEIIDLLHKFYGMRERKKESEAEEKLLINTIRISASKVNIINQVSFSSSGISLFTRVEKETMKPIRDS